MVTTLPGPQPATPPTDEALTAALRRLPLVARPHLPCSPLDTRLAEIAELADAATSAPDPASLVAVAHNKAALIASDHGLPDLARELCWRHHARYTTTRPWTARHARLALEPLINLARPDIRHGRADDAIILLTALSTSIDTGQPATISGRTIHLNGPPRGSDDHQDIRIWLWTLVLSEGLRALSAAGRWRDALTHAERHHGIGQRLLDGRQVAIIAHTVTGDHDRAAHLINESDLRTPWEHAVAAALATTGPRPSPARTAKIARMVDRYLDVHLDARHTLFSVRLGLTVLDLAGGPEHPDAARAAARVRSYATSAHDAYVAREVIAHPVHAILTPAEQAELAGAVRTAVQSHQGQELECRLESALDRCPPAT